jgi:N-methylhydantoinase A
MRIAIGVDVGGTFTDAVAVDDLGRPIAHRKEPSTPPRVEEGAISTIGSLTADSGVPASRVVHGTTVAANALLERRIARVGLLTTEGFRDVLAVGTQSRPDLYDVMQQKARPLVPRSLCLEARERMAADGSVVRPLDEETVSWAARRFRRERVEAVAVSFLFSYVNPDHERRAGEILRRLCPNVEIVLSSEVSPLIREYPRTCTTVINAVLRPLVSQYLRELEVRAGSPVLVMQSNGGVIPAEEAARHGHLLIHSGPAGGVIGATLFGSARGVENLVTMDMGGTSFETCLVLGGGPTVRGELAAEGEPVLASTIDLETVGAGGGSVAWVDPGRALRVGPESAGAVPGPACYDRGGTRPTVTDANLVIGRLDPSRFLDGRLPLDVQAAKFAIHRHVAEHLGVGVERAAAAIIEVATAAMARALRVVTVGRGWDPAQLPLVAFGGAGPLHAARLAEELGAPRVLIPPLPGFISAIGLLASDLTSEVAETVLRPGRGEATAAELSRAAARMGLAAAARLGADAAGAVTSLAVDCRYRGQGFELTVPLAATTEEGLEGARRGFHERHDAVFGHAAPEEPVEIVTLRVTATAKSAGVRPAPLQVSDTPSPTDAREILDEGWVEALVFDRKRLPPGWSGHGPAIVEEGESTTWVPAGWTLAVDHLGSLELTRA